MKQKLLNNIGIKILSVLAAIIIWVLVVNVDDYMITKVISNIPVNIINEDVITGLDKVYELEDDGMVRVIVKGRRSVVEGLTAEDFVATADLSKLSLTNAVQISVTPENTALASQLTISCPDNMLSVTLENRMEQQLPVTVLAQGEPAEGYAVVSKTSTPNMVIVSGAESVVKRIKTVQVTVDVSGARDDVSFVAQPVYLNTDGERVKSEKIKANVDAVNAVVEIVRTKEIPVSVKTSGEVSVGYAVAAVEYQPTSIEVAGREDVLSTIDALEINDVNIAGLSEDTEITIEAADYLPTGVQAIEGMEQIMIRVILEPVTTRSFELSAGDIGFVGRQDAYIYRISGITSEMEKSPMVHVKGIVSLVNALSVSDLSLKVDVTDLQEGEYDLEITYTLSDELVGSSTAKAHVVIVPKPGE